MTVVSKITVENSGGRLNRFPRFGKHQGYLVIAQGQVGLEGCSEPC